MKLLCLFGLVCLAAVVDASKRINSEKLNQFRRSLAAAKGITLEEQKAVENEMKKINQETGKELRKKHSQNARKLMAKTISQSRSLTQNGLEKEPISIESINQKEGIAELLYQGDINLSPEQAKALSSAGRNKRFAQYSVNPKNKWNGTVNYRFDYKFPAEHEAVIRKGIAFWNDRTCLNFVENGTGPTIAFIKEGGCWSELGRSYGNKQALSIGTNCENVRTVIHELGHALGVVHEQSRHDRDDYVTINVQNIDKKHSYNFDKEGDSKVYTSAYDYGSVMHYVHDSFAVEGGIPTIFSKNSLFQRTMGVDSTFQDVIGMNEYYGCLNKCDAVFRTKCHNGGFNNPKDCSKCVCPPAYSGKNCTERSKGRGTQADAGNCGADLTPTSEWQSVSSRVGQSEQLTEAAECFHIIRAKPEQKVLVRFSQMVEAFCASNCYWQGVQVFINNNAINNPYTFCCGTDEVARKTFESNGTAIVKTYSRVYHIQLNIEYKLA